MYVDKSLMQRKAKISPFQSSVTKTYFSLGDLSAFFKVTYSGQKLNYKDYISSAHLQLPGMALWETAWVCHLSCPSPEPAQLYATTAGCGHPPSSAQGDYTILSPHNPGFSDTQIVADEEAQSHPTVGESPLPSMQC